MKGKGHREFLVSLEGWRDDSVAVSGAVCRGGCGTTANGEDWASEGAGHENAGPAQGRQGPGDGEDAGMHLFCATLVEHCEHPQDPEPRGKARHCHSHGPGAVEDPPP